MPTPTVVFDVLVRNGRCLACGRSVKIVAVQTGPEGGFPEAVRPIAADHIALWPDADRTAIVHHRCPARECDGR